MRRPNAAVLLKQASPSTLARVLPLPYTIYVRSFETRTRFACPFTSKGDGRGFSAKLGRATTARIRLRIG
jgi:hypothetical protein